MCDPIGIGTLATYPIDLLPEQADSSSVTSPSYPLWRDITYLPKVLDGDTEHKIAPKSALMTCLCMLLHVQCLCVSTMAQIWFHFIRLKEGWGELRH